MQRKLETAMRHQRRLMAGSQSAGLESDATDAEIKYNRLSQKYTEFSESAGLTQQRNRIIIDENSGRNVVVAGYGNASGIFVNSKEQLYRYAQKVKPEDGFQDFTCHANATSFEIRMELNEKGYPIETVDISPETFALLIKNSASYNGGNIRILSCSAGALDNGAAQRLADALGVNVKAPTETLYVDDLGNCFVTDDENLAYQWGLLEKSQKDTLKQTGDWRVFEPKQKGE